MTIAALVAVLIAGGTYLVLQRDLVRVAFGVALLGHGANFILLSAGVLAWRTEPLASKTSRAAAADPLPQAFVLTAIVITLAVTILMLGFAVIGHNDDTHQIPATGEEHDS